MAYIALSVRRIKIVKRIWNELYGYQSNEFIRGVIAGIEMYAVWKNGKQVVGVQETPLEAVIEEVKQQLGYESENNRKE